MTKSKIFLASLIMAIVFATIIVPWKSESEERTLKTTSDMSSIIYAMNYYVENVGPLPIGTEAIFSALRRENPKNLIILDNTDGDIDKMLDPWGYPYQISVHTDGVFQVISGGANGTSGDQDDIIRRGEPKN
jgi:hypothetical protein